VTKQKPHEDHYKDQDIAFPGHKGKSTPATFHGKDARHILIHDAKKSKMVNKESENKSNNYRQNSTILLFGP